MFKDNRLYLALIILSFVFLSDCGKQYPFDPSTLEEEQVSIEEEQVSISGSIELPENIDPTTITIVSTSGSYSVQEDGTYDAVRNQMSKQFLFAENQNGEILLASLPDSEEINANTTARAMVALLPWTGFVNDTDLSTILDEVALLDGYNEFIDAIQTAVNSGISPLSDNKTLELLRELNLKITKAETDSVTSSLKTKNLNFLIPEVDYSVEPVLEYSAGTLTIKNDGTTIAGWGVELFKDGTSITGNLVLPGNIIKFPSLSSIWNWFSGEFLNAVFEEGEPLDIPIPIDGKYEIHFKSPTSSELLNSDLAIEALRVNIGINCLVFLKAFGLEIFRDPESFWSKEGLGFIDAGCNNKIFNSTIDVIINSIEKRELTVAFFRSQVGNLLKGLLDSLDECFPDSKLTSGAKYVKKLLAFLNVYAKAEAVYITSKLYADMFVLQDIKICRQINNDNLHPIREQRRRLKQMLCAKLLECSEEKRC